MKNVHIKDVRVPLRVVLGETELPVEDIARMGQGTIIELSSNAGEPVDLYAAGERIARGEVVVIDDNFGIRVTELLGEEG